MSFSAIRARMNDAIFARLGEEATWTGLADAVRVIPREQDDELQFGQNLRVERVNWLRVRKSEVPSPAEGDEVAVAALGVTFRVIGTPRLMRHLVWRCEVVVA